MEMKHTADKKFCNTNEKFSQFSSENGGHKETCTHRLKLENPSADLKVLEQGSSISSLKKGLVSLDSFFKELDALIIISKRKEGDTCIKLPTYGKQVLFVIKVI